MKYKRQVTTLAIVVLVVLVGAAILFILSRDTRYKVEEHFAKEITTGNCTGAYTLLSSKEKQDILLQDFHDQFCKVLKDKKLKKTHQTSDIDLDMDNEYTTTYEINPVIMEGKYLLLDSRYFYESETIEGLQFSNTINWSPGRR